MFDTTKHAAAVIAARNIRQEWIEAVLTSPTLVQPDADDAELEHRLAVIADYGNRVLRVSETKHPASARHYCLL